MYQRQRAWFVLTLAGIAIPSLCLAQAQPCPVPSLSVDGGTSVTTACISTSQTLAQQYPGDVGMSGNSDVVWTENFEEGSVPAIAGRYSEVNNAAGMSLASSVPTKSSGAASLRLLSNGAGEQATGLYKNLVTGYDELFVRYYVKYQGGVPWHHAGVTLGGRNPPLNWHEGMAGLKPNGDDRVSFSLEPIATGTDVVLDSYNYWMGMHSWMDIPSGTGAYYGNTVLHEPSAKAPDNTWVCVEMHAKLNPDPAKGAGAELEVWLNDKSVRRFTSTAPVGYWVRDKFCAADTTDPECTRYHNAGMPLVPLDVRFRSTKELKLNYFWAQNYITDNGQGSLWYDDMVVAKRRIGCLQ